MKQRKDSYFPIQKMKLAKQAYKFVFVSSLICFAAMARTGYYGGQIRHSEIRSGVALNGQSEQGNDIKNAGSDKEDDD